MRNLIFIFLLMGTASCATQEVEQLQTEVIAIHDEVMPEMKTIAELKASLNDLLQNPPPNVRLNRVEINACLENLEIGRNAMINWMKQFSKVNFSESKTKNLTYLKDQKIKIEDVKEKMTSSIQAAKKLLNEGQ